LIATGSTEPSRRRRRIFFEVINDEIVSIKRVGSWVAADRADGATILCQLGKVGGHVVGGTPYSGAAMLFL
jgi:hypothetical protein